MYKTVYCRVNSTVSNQVYSTVHSKVFSTMQNDGYMISFTWSQASLDKYVYVDADSSVHFVQCTIQYGLVYYIRLSKLYSTVQCSVHCKGVREASIPQRTSQPIQLFKVRPQYSVQQSVLHNVLFSLQYNVQYNVKPNVRKSIQYSV